MMMSELEKAKTIKVTQTGSPIGRHHRQRANLVGLGLNKMGRSKVWPVAPQVLGKINKVRHLVTVEILEG